MSSFRSLLRPAGVALAVLLVPMVVCIETTEPVRAADHLDAPLIRQDLGLDLLDFYAFQSPQTPGNTVFILTTNPLSGVASEDVFSTGGSFELRIDEDADAQEDSVYTVKFGKPESTGRQKMTVALKGSSDKFKAKGATRTALDLPNGGKILAAKFDDPFFFDFIGFRAGFQFSPETSHNFFRGFDVMGIVLEVPSSTFPSQNIGAWATTTRKRKQFDRNGRPAINSVLIPGPSKNAFNVGHPSDDVADFRSIMVTSIEGLGRTTQDAEGLADILLPDILTLDTANPAGFLNGRRLEDDVVDAELNLLTNGAITTDNVDNDTTFLTVFPYLAPPNRP